VKRSFLEPLLILFAAGLAVALPVLYLVLLQPAMQSMLLRDAEKQAIVLAQQITRQQLPGDLTHQPPESVRRLLAQAARTDGVQRLLLLSPAGEVLFDTVADSNARPPVALLVRLRRQRSTVVRLDRASPAGFSTGEMVDVARVLVPIVRAGRLQAVLWLDRELGDRAEELEQLQGSGLVITGVISALLFLAAVALGLCSWFRRRRIRMLGEDLQQQQSMNQAMLTAVAQPVYIKGADGRFLGCNNAFADLVGRSREEICGQKVVDSIRLELPEIYRLADRELLEQGGVQSYGTQLRVAGGELHNVVLRKALFYGPDGSPAGIVGTVEDQSEQSEALEAIRRLAYYDELTGLPNRALLMDRLQQAMAHARNRERLVALLLVDLDHFKRINDHYGHAVGDALLRHVAELLRGMAGPNDTVARFGGDDFVLLLTDLESAQPAAERVDELCRQLDTVFDTAGRTIYVSASIGIALFPLDSPDAPGLFKNAEMAMYTAKERGRNRYRFFTRSLDRNFRQRQELELGLRKALEQNQFYLDYQPQVDLQRGCIVGAEALLRWAHPERGLIPPAEFIPLAEESGLIKSIGAWGLRTACAQAMAWRAAGLPPIRMAVNISGSQFSDPDFIDTIDQVLAETGLEPEWLELELTESLLMRTAERNITALVDFKTRGLTLAIDDFGTGYSSLAYLKHLPIDTLKIDRSFVLDLGRDNDSVTIIDAVLALAHSMGLQVTVEGVETREQLAYFRELEGIVIQGYHFGRPVPADAFGRRLAQGIEAELLR